MKKILITICVAILIFISFNSSASAWEIKNNQLISSNILNLNYDNIYLIDTTEEDYLSFENPNIYFFKMSSGVDYNYQFKNTDRLFHVYYEKPNINVMKLVIEYTKYLQSNKLAFLIELNKNLTYNDALEYLFNFYTFDDSLEDNYFNYLSVLAAKFDKNSNEIAGLYNNLNGIVFNKNSTDYNIFEIRNQNIFCNNRISFCYSSGIDAPETIFNLNEINSIIISFDIIDDIILDFNLELKPENNNDYYFTPFGLKYNNFDTSKQNQELIKVFDTNNYFIESDNIEVLNSADYSIINGYVAIKDKGTKSININYLAPPTINGSLENFSKVFVFAFKNIGYNSDAGVLSINGSESRYIDNYVYTLIDLGEYTSDFQLPYTNFNINSTNYSSAKVIFGIVVAPQFLNLTYVPHEQKYHINDSAVKTYLTTLENSFNTDVDSYNNGVNYGYNQGYQNGVNDGRVEGFDRGYQEGARDGYQNGLNNSGTNAWKNVWDFIYNIFTFIGRFLDIELVAGIKVGYIVSFIISLSLISFLINIFRG